MLIKNSLIQIFDRNTALKKYEFELVNSVIINSSRNTFTDTATVILPNRLRRKNNQIKFEINIGDNIVIQLGYKPNLITEFDGFISKVDPDSPMTLECEDAMFLLKRKSLESFVLKDTTLLELIQKVYVDQVDEQMLRFGITGAVSIVDAPIGTMKVDKNQTPVDVFNALRKTFKTFVFFKNKILNVHILVPSEVNKIVLFHSQQNVPEGTEDLNFQNDTDGNVVAYGISENKDGTKVEVYAYYQDNLPDNEIVVTTERPLGTLNTFKVPNRTQQQMEELVTQWLPNLWYTGAIGQISTFGAPSIEHGDVARLRNEKFEDRSGDYRITGVNKEFSIAAGYKQTATLGLKIND